MLDLVITTSRKPTETLRQRADHWSRRLGAPVVPRAERKLDRLCMEESVKGVLVVGPEREVFHLPAEGVEYFFHPNLASLRINNLKSQGVDHMVRAMKLEPGDEVLDCTLGFAAEAIVCAWAVGDTGRVVGLEKQPIIANLAIEGLKRGEFVSENFVAVMRRVEAICADHAEYLPACDDGAFDVVYFDPIFDDPVQKSDSMKPLRAVADNSPLSREAVAQARRVARRCVVIKQRRKSELWKEFGVTELHGGANSRVAWGVLPAD